MKNIIYLFFFSISFFACKNQADIKQNTPSEKKGSKVEYPANLSKVFEQHGGLDLWKKQRTLSYNIVKDESNEAQTIDLWDRREFIVGENFTTGHDGSNTWLKADTSVYKGNAYFYHNLMFYFYAMPFVLADEGIIYSDIEPLEFEGKSYPGIGIAYKSNVGISPEDEYFMYYDEVTNEMAWLGYTVTFFSQEKSKRISYIRYNDWKSVDGVKLPNSLSWYKSEEGKVTELRSTRMFEDVKLSTDAAPDMTYAIPEGGKIITK